VGRVAPQRSQWEKRYRPKSWLDRGRPFRRASLADREDLAAQLAQARRRRPFRLVVQVRPLKSAQCLGWVMEVGWPVASRLLAIKMRHSPSRVGRRRAPALLRCWPAPWVWLHSCESRSGEPSEVGFRWRDRCSWARARAKRARGRPTERGWQWERFLGCPPILNYRIIWYNRRALVGSDSFDCCRLRVLTSELSASLWRLYQFALLCWGGREKAGESWEKPALKLVASECF